MARLYSVKASSWKWPVHTFYNILDLAAINAWIIYKKINGINISRKKFIQGLAEELRSEYLQKKILPESDQEGVSSVNQSRSRKQCQILKECKEK